MAQRKGGAWQEEQRKKQADDERRCESSLRCVAARLTCLLPLRGVRRRRRMCGSLRRQSPGWSPGWSPSVQTTVRMLPSWRNCGSIATACGLRHPSASENRAKLDVPGGKGWEKGRVGQV